MPSPVRASLLFFSLTLLAPLSLSAYHLELEARPAAVFPWLAKFGTVRVHVYPGGVRAETLWLNAFTANGASAITVENRIARLYTQIPITSIAAVLERFGSGAERGIVPESQSSSPGTVRGMKATRHRLVYGPKAYIDYWTTDAIPPNPQLRRVIDDLVTAISPATGEAARKVSGTPIYVELNFRRFKKVVLVRLASLSPSSDGEAAALSVGSFYVKAPLIDSIWSD